MFLEGYLQFGRKKISDAERDTYVLEMAQLAKDLGIPNPPLTYAELRAALEIFRPELRLIPECAVARDFVANEIIKDRFKKIGFWFFVQSSYALMEPWARDLLGVPRRVRLNKYFIKPLTVLLCRGLRIFVPPFEPPRS